MTWLRDTDWPEELTGAWAEALTYRAQWRVASDLHFSMEEYDEAVKIFEQARAEIWLWRSIH